MVVAWKGIAWLNFIGTQKAIISAIFVKVNPKEFEGLEYFFYVPEAEKPFYAVKAYQELSEYLDGLPNNEVTLEFIIYGRWVAWGILSPSFNGYYGPIEESATINRDLILNQAK